MSLLLILLFFVGMTYLDPPQEYGIAVNFGTSNVGQGNVQPKEPLAPAPEKIKEEIEEVKQEVQEEVVEESKVEVVEEEKVYEIEDQDEQPDDFIVQQDGGETPDIDDDVKMEMLQQQL